MREIIWLSEDTDTVFRTEQEAWDSGQNFIQAFWCTNCKTIVNLKGDKCPSCYEPDANANSARKTQGFITKDSGKRIEYMSGMHRDTNRDKARYDLIDLSMLRRWAELMSRGAIKYGERNWEKANSIEEYNRFKESAFRHLVQWFAGETDEDHAAAVLFNIAAAEYVKIKIDNKMEEPNDN